MSLIAINWRPQARQLRLFGALCLIFFGGAGIWVYATQSLLGVEIGPQTAFRLGSALSFAAAVCGLLGALAPTVLRPLYLGLTLLALPVGLVVSYMVMALLYYGVVTPVGLVMRVLGRDPMRRRFDRRAPSYWEPREPAGDVERYFRQF